MSEGISVAESEPGGDEVKECEAIIAARRRELRRPANVYYFATTALLFVGMFWVSLRRTVLWDGRLRRFMSPGWLDDAVRLVYPRHTGDHGLDLSDLQWRQLHGYMPVLAGAFSVWAAASRGVRRAAGAASPLRKAWYLACSAAFLVFLHRRGAAVCVALALGNYALARALGASRWAPGAAWAYHVLVTLMMYWTDGLSDVPPALQPLADWLDASEQLVPWHVIFKITLLRFLSFSVDYNWALRNTPLNKRVMVKSPLERQQEEHRPLSEYSLVDFLMYSFYIPLYLGGPILTFNAFMAQFKEPQRTVSVWECVWTGAKLAAYFVLFDVVGHFSHMLCVNERRLWYMARLPTYELLLMCLYVLGWMYVKFLIMWRTFRVFSVVDGFDTHENMPHCIFTVNRPSYMWRSWHASFNRWTVRYLYVPLGGQRTQLATAWLIFVFIGLWHGLELPWLAWALLNCAGLFLELAAARLVARSPRLARCRARAPWWVHVECLGYTFNIALLVVSNLSISHGFFYTWNLLRLIATGDDAWWSIPLFLAVIWNNAHNQKIIQDIGLQRAKIARANYAKTQ